MMKRIQRSLPRKHPKKPLRRKRKMGKKKMMIKPMWKIMEKDILNYMQQPELNEQNIFKIQFIHPDKGINCFNCKIFISSYS